MGLDAKLKRWWWAVLAVMIAGTSLLQAMGVGRMVAAALSGGSAAPVEPPKVAGARVFEGRDKSGLAILSRNIFDSQTGPLDGSTPPPVPVVDAAPPSDAPIPSTSSEVPPCDSGRLVFVSTSNDPEWAFAAIEDSSGRPQIARQGQEMNGHVVRAFAWDRVLLEQSGRFCQLELFAKPKTMATPTPAATPAAPAKPGAGGIAPELAAKIHKVSDTEFNVERSVVDDILENQAELMRSARITPDKQGDKVLGIRLLGIRSNTLLSTLGFKNGDRLETINGFDMSDPQKALEAYGRLRTADALHVKINRGGAPMTIDFKVQ